MTGAGLRRDLIVLAADLDIQNVVRGLLPRTESLNIRRVSFDVERHPDRDGGCRTRAAAQLRPFRETHSRALVIFDLYGCGSGASREETQAEVEARLADDGWQGRSKAIVIDPEIEAWVWGRSERLPGILGWPGGGADLRRWLGRGGFWPQDRPKPAEPKKAMKAVLKEARAPGASDRFLRLARETSLRGCRDPAFRELGRTLRAWFPGT